MGSEKQLVIGLFGFGVVGEGLYKVLKQTPSLKATIKKVCIKNIYKKRNAPAELFTTEMDDILNDPEINVVVEVINDSFVGYEIVSTALKNGKDVVSASKKMLSEHLPELIELQNTTGRSLLYEASSCASIPIIRNLEEYYDNDLLHAIKAIVNGSTNFILTKMFEEQLNFKEALLMAQQLGFAESDPTLDIEGFDAANKWVTLDELMMSARWMCKNVIDGIDETFKKWEPRYDFELIKVEPLEQPKHFVKHVIAQ
jgi:homoserine dehydrogenase